MPAREAAGMRRYPLLPRSFRRLDSRVRFALTFLAAAAITALLTPQGRPPPQQLVRWTALGHDWLLVADREHDRIDVYDAADGRPLRTLDRAAGLADVERLVLEGRSLVVLGKDAPRVVWLPQLQAQPRELAVR